jgi:hypothetical protein
VGESSVDDGMRIFSGAGNIPPSVSGELNPLVSAAYLFIWSSPIVHFLCIEWFAPSQQSGRTSRHPALAGSREQKWK